VKQGRALSAFAEGGVLNLCLVLFMRSPVKHFEKMPATGAPMLFKFMDTSSSA
jgi:hypothetical protein